MKKIVMIVVLLLLMIPTCVNASVKLECYHISVKPGSDVVCNVNSNDYYINGFSSNIKLSDKLEFVSFKKENNWEGNVIGNRIGLYSSNNMKSVKLGDITVRVKNNVTDGVATISLVNSFYSDSNFNSIKVNDVSSNINIMSFDNRLSKLDVSSGNVNFSPDILSYNIDVNDSFINIDASSVNDSSLVSGDIGRKDLKYGENIFKINVTNEKGDVKTYTLNVNRVDNRSGDSKLSSLNISGYDIKFNKDVFNYNINVSNDVSSVKINAKLNSDKSSFVSGYGSRSVNLKEGLNKYEVKVTAENGTVSTYTLNITRGEKDNSNNNFLEDIQIKDNNIDFAKEKLEYEINVGYETNSLDINSIVSSSSSNVEIMGNENFSVGKNVVTIRVTSSLGEVREYKIIVNKKDKVDVLSSNNYLKNIIINGYEIDFSREKYDYSLKIKNESSLDIKVICEDDLANFKIIGNNNLERDSVILISVTAEDGSVREYRINIDKKSEVNWYAIVIMVEAIVVICVIGLFIVKKKKDNFYEDFK